MEIFIDADAGGGDYLHNYNAFAYCISADNQAADMGPFLSDEDRIAPVNGAYRNRISVFLDVCDRRYPADHLLQFLSTEPEVG